MRGKIAEEMSSAQYDIFKNNLQAQEHAASIEELDADLKKLETKE